jgi:enoyl-CoA hydratase/carnithine racemase
MLNVAHDGAITRITLARPAKRNALSDEMVLALGDELDKLPADTRAIVLDAQGEHFCAGLDLNMLRERDAGEGMLHSRMWHTVFDRLQFGRVPVVAVLHGAVVGGGLELACSAHLRVAETSAFYALPEGTRGIFVGGGGSVRVPRLVGVPVMTDMMLTGRVYDAQDGLRVGFSQYLVEPGQGLDKASALASRIAANAPMSNYAVMHALPRIAGLSTEDGFFMESMIAGIAQADESAKQRMRAFLDTGAGKVRKQD